MKTRAIFLSSENDIKLISSKYQTKRETFWQNQFVFELLNLSDDQKIILKHLNHSHKDCLHIYLNEDQNIFLLQFTNSHKSSDQLALAQINE